MLSESLFSPPKIHISLQIPAENQSIVAVIKFVEHQLPEFRKRYSKRIINEDELTQKLVILLNSNCSDHLFTFVNDYIEKISLGHAKKPDIGVISRKSIILNAKSFSDDESFFSIEAKRLDSSLPKLRKNEYVAGRFETVNGKKKYNDCGGIERFKRGVHGEQLSFAGLLGYMQSDDFVYWEKLVNFVIKNKINEDLSEINLWQNEDLLEVITQEKIFRKYQSGCRREKGILNLYHIWVDLMT